MNGKKLGTRKASECLFYYQIMNKEKHIPTLEEAVASSLLETPTGEVEVCGAKFPLCSPTPATLIMLSSIASRLPRISRGSANILSEVLTTAHTVGADLGRALAVLILGAKRVREGRRITLDHTRKVRRFSFRKMRFVEKEQTFHSSVREYEWLSERVLEELSPDALLSAVAQRLNMMQVGSFFELTAFLSEANMLKATREAEETALGDK